MFMTSSRKFHRLFSLILFSLSSRNEAGDMDEACRHAHKDEKHLYNISFSAQQEG